MNIPASVRSAFSASTANNGAVDADGIIDFDKAPARGFAWSESHTRAMPFIPAARYYVGNLSPAARESVIQEAVCASLDLQQCWAITGASVTTDNTHLEVWARPGWHPRGTALVRESIESALAKHETPEAPTGTIAKLFYSEDKQRAQLAGDRRELFIENWVDRTFFS